MTERPEELVEDLIDETRGPEEDPPTIYAADDDQATGGAFKDDVPANPEPPD